MALLLLAGCINSALAIEVTEQEVQQAAVSSQVVSRVAALTRLYNNSDFRALEFNLSQLTPLQQEAVRAQLVQHAVEFGRLDQMKADWLQAQADRKPAFTVVEQGDGYLITQSAFHYGAQSRGLVLQWQQILLAQEMVQQAEAGSLILSKWLTGDIHTQKQRRNLFIEQLPNLSPDAVAKLVAQFSSDSHLMWLPDNAIIASLAALSGDQPLYHLLWRRRTDQYSLAELNRLADLAPSPQAVEQLMAATINPSLKQQAYRALAVQKPMSPQTREFLVDKLNEVDDGHVVATQLAQQGYASWLKQIAASSRNQVLQKNLQLALTELP